MTSELCGWCERTCLHSLLPNRVDQEGTLLRSLCLHLLLNHTVIHILTQLHELVPLVKKTTVNQGEGTLMGWPNDIPRVYLSVQQRPFLCTAQWPLDEGADHAPNGVYKWMKWGTIWVTRWCVLGRVIIDIVR